jgi:hypothetical protein
MGVRRPNWWCYPERCQNGHEWAPGRIIVSWQPCECGPAVAEREHGPGHLVVHCQAPGCVVPAAARPLGEICMNRGAVSPGGKVDRKGRAGRGGRARPTSSRGIDQMLPPLTRHLRVPYPDP